MGKAVFTVSCPELAFHRTHEIPLDARGYCHQLADDLERAIQFYLIRAENHKLKQEMERLRKEPCDG